MSVVLDTHSVLWYLQNSPDLSGRARATIEEAIQRGQDVQVSAISVIETIYLAERQRVPAAALQRLRSALADSDSGLRIAAVDAAVADAVEKVSRSAVPDMPDRIIVATAMELGLPLVTRDRRIQMAGVRTIW